MLSISPAILGQCFGIGDSSGTIQDQTQKKSVGYFISMSSACSFRLDPNGPFLDSCGITFPAITAPWSGNTRNSSVTFNFSHPIISIDILTGYTSIERIIAPETFIFKTNASGSGTNVSVFSGSCAPWDVVNNKTTSPQIAGAINSIHTISASSPFTSLTIYTYSDGFNGGSQFAICERSLIIPFQKGSLGGDISLCEGDSILLDASTPNSIYLWQDGSSDATLIVKEPGNYWVTVTTNSYSVSDTISISFFSNPKIDLGADTAICDGEVLVLNPGEFKGKYKWQNGSTHPYYIVNRPGIYWVEVEKDNCFSSDTIIVRDLNCETVSIAGLNIIVFPNPTFDRQTITVRSNIPRHITVELIEVSGKKVQNVWGGMLKSNEKHIESNLSRLKGGIYFYRIRTGKEVAYLKTIKI